MSSKILIDLNVTITCPKCSAEFALVDGLAQKTIDQYEADLDKVFREREDEITARVKKQAETKAASDLKDQLELLQEQLKDKDEALDTAKQKELEHLREKRKLEDARKDLELEIERKVDALKGELEEKIKSEEEDRFNLLEREYKKKLDAAETAAKEMERKLRQGSVQLQGEILELKIEDDLAAAFPNDTINPVKSGKRGADVIQEVISQSGKSCGKILYEVKRAQNWSSKWLDKLKEDQIAEGADHAVLATTALPKDATDAINFINGVWVISEGAVVVLAGMLRYSLLEVNKVKIAHTDRESKVELLYEYLNSPQFAQKLRVVADSFQKMNDDINRERAAMERLWSKREAEVKRVLMSMAGIVGDLQGYSQTPLPQLDDIKALSLTTDDLE
jgi:hypothetical protein